MNLQITDNTTGKTYRVPEDLKAFAKMTGCATEKVTLQHNFLDTGTVLWILRHSYLDAELNMYTGYFLLEDSRFTVSLSGSIPEERETALEIFSKLAEKKQGVLYDVVRDLTDYAVLYPNILALASTYYGISESDLITKGEEK